MHSQSPDNHSQFLYQVLTVFIYEGNTQHLKFSFKIAHLFYSLETPDGIHSSSLKIGEQFQTEFVQCNFKIPRSHTTIDPPLYVFESLAINPPQP